METALESGVFGKGVKDRPREEMIREVDKALAEDGKRKSGDNAAAEEKSVKHPLFDQGRLPQVLRWLGATALVVAAVTYMVQGINLSATMDRYWNFLVMTAVLGALGVSFGLGAREVKGARTFLGLAAATLPVHFSQLGAMIHALVAEAPASMPSSLVFTAHSPSSVLLAAAATMALLVPLTWFGFSIYARPKALPLTVTYFTAGAVILLPMREHWIMAVVTLATAALVRGADRVLFSGDARLRSFEGVVVRCMLASPLAIIVGRSLFYPLGALHVSLLLLGTGALLFFDLFRMAPEGRFRSVVQAMGSVFMASGWLLFIGDLLEPAALLSPRSYFLYLPISALLYGLSYIGLERNVRPHRLCAAAIGFLTVAGVHFASPSTVTSITAILAGSVLTAVGVSNEEKAPLFAGLAAAAIGMSFHLQAAWDLYTRNLWLSLAVTGTCILIVASFFEMKGEQLRNHIGRYLTLLRGWH